MKHLDFHHLIEVFESQRESDIGGEVADHLAECSDCRSDHQRLAAFFSIVGPTELEPVPQATTAHLLNIYQPKRMQKFEEPVTERRGFLIFDDWQTALAERFSGSDTRQMVFESGDVALDLRVSFVGDDFHLAGQLISGDPNGTVELSLQGAITSTEMNEQGEFEFSALVQGHYDIRIVQPTGSILFQNVPLES